MLVLVPSQLNYLGYTLRSENGTGWAPEAQGGKRGNNWGPELDRKKKRAREEWDRVGRTKEGMGLTRRGSDYARCSEMGWWTLGCLNGMGEGEWSQETVCYTFRSR